MDLLCNKRGAQADSPLVVDLGPSAAPAAVKRMRRGAEPCRGLGGKSFQGRHACHFRTAHLGGLLVT